MKKFLSYIMVLFVFMFIGNINARAISSSISKSGNLYIYEWKDVTYESNNNYGVTCSNATITNGNTKVEDYPSGSVTIQSNISSGDITCKIYKNDPASGNPALTSASITVGSTTTKKQEQPTTTTQAPKSNNANLKTLNVVADDDSEVTLSPKFNASTYEYEATVASTIRTIVVNATMEDSKANMIISNNVNEELKPGENNKITVTVTAEDGTKKAYIINVKREALTADATLQSLSIKECKSFELKPDKFTYTVKVKKNVKELTLDYVLSDENSTIEIEGNEDLKDGSKVKITVTAEDGTKKVYTLTISKKQETTKKDTSNISAEKNPLIIMGLSIIAFGLIGGIIYVIKK